MLPLAYGPQIEFTLDVRDFFWITYLTINLSSPDDILSAVIESLNKFWVEHQKNVDQCKNSQFYAEHRAEFPFVKSCSL